MTGVADEKTDAVDGFPDRDQLVQAWGDHIIGRLRPKAKALFQAGRFMGATGDRARFGLPNEIHRVRCEELRPEVEGALADHFECRIVLDLVVDPGAEGPLAGPPAEGAAPAPRTERPSTGPGGRGRPTRPVSGGGQPSGDRPPDGPGAAAITAPPGAGEPGTGGSPESGSLDLAGAPEERRGNRVAPEPAMADESGADRGPGDEYDDLSSFDESELGEVAVVDNSAQSRVLQAFPGAEEVT